MGTSKKNLDPFPRKTESCFPQQGSQKREIGCQRTFSEVLWRSEQRQLEVRPRAAGGRQDGTSVWQLLVQSWADLSVWGLKGSL